MFKHKYPSIDFIIVLSLLCDLWAKPGSQIRWQGRDLVRHGRPKGVVSFGNGWLRKLPRWSSTHTSSKALTRHSGWCGGHGDQTVLVLYCHCWRTCSHCLQCKWGTAALNRTPSGCLPCQVFWVSLFRRHGADPGHPGGILSLGWPLRIPQRSWWKWLEGVSGPPCLNCIPLWLVFIFFLLVFLMTEVWLQFHFNVVFSWFFWHFYLMELVSSSLPNLCSSFLVSFHPHRIIFHHLLLLTPSLCRISLSLIYFDP